MRILLAILALIVATPVQAQEWTWRTYCNQFRTHCVQRKVRVYQPRVYGYERRDDDDWRRESRRTDQCQESDVDVLSTEHQSEDNAREAARKLWMAKVQWTLGGQYMDLDEAAHIRWRCGPSNAHDTVAGKLSEVAGALTGKGGQNVRCALWARPCRVERKADDIRGRK